jgi:CheY-like chemotaxis protein
MATILIVEDNTINQELLARRLRWEGFEVLTAGDGRQGVDTAQIAMPDLILMDMSLPKLDGWQATRLIKSADLTRIIPIIALTAHAMAEDQQKCLAAGCDDYETKPIDFGRLLDKMQALLKARTVGSATQVSPAVG